MFDAVNVYARALRGIGGTKAIKAEPNSCANRSITGWSSGFSLINFMRVVSHYIRYHNNCVSDTILYFIRKKQFLIHSDVMNVLVYLITYNDFEAIKMLQ